LHLSGIKKALRVPLIRTPGTTRCKSTLKTQNINFTKNNFIHPVVDPNYESIDQVQVQLVQFRFSTGNKVNSVNRESNKRKLHKYTCNSYRLYHSISCQNILCPNITVLYDKRSQTIWRIEKLRQCTWFKKKTLYTDMKGHARVRIACAMVATSSKSVQP